MMHENDRPLPKIRWSSTYKKGSKKSSSSGSSRWPSETYQKEKHEPQHEISVKKVKHTEVMDTSMTISGKSYTIMPMRAVMEEKHTWFERDSCVNTIIRLKSRSRRLTASRRTVFHGLEKNKRTNNAIDRICFQKLTCSSSRK